MNLNIESIPLFQHINEYQKYLDYILSQTDNNVFLFSPTKMSKDLEISYGKVNKIIKYFANKNILQFLKRTSKTKNVGNSLYTVCCTNLKTQVFYKTVYDIIQSYFYGTIEYQIDIRQIKLEEDAKYFRTTRNMIQNARYWFQQNWNYIHSNSSKVIRAIFKTFLEYNPNRKTIENSKTIEYDIDYEKQNIVVNNFLLRIIEFSYKTDEEQYNSLLKKLQDYKNPPELIFKYFAELKSEIEFEVTAYSKELSEI